LPENFGNLEVESHLYLGDNQLASLPESFGNLEVGHSLDLSFNELTSLPESFRNLKVGRKLWLQSNPWIINADFVNFCEKYEGELVLGKKLEKDITTFLKRQKKLEEWEEPSTDKHRLGGSLSDYKEDIDSSINDAVKTNSFTPYTAGYILEDGSLLVMDEYHGEVKLREFYPEYSNTHPEEDTCVRLYGRPNEAQYKRLEEIIDYYLDHESYCKVEVWDKPLGTYSFYEVYSLYEGACKYTTWDEKIGNWTGYKLVQIIKNYFAFGAK